MQFLFASDNLSRDPTTGKWHRYHLDRDTFAVRLNKAVKQADICKPVTSHTLRHLFATHLLLDHVGNRTVEEVLGHSDVKTTMLYLHVVVRDDIQVTSPNADQY
ncbi:MAG: tyrosine-type recombinase/integrase [Planctomycetales bacterium]|nr:tyrosine-type recombinase/integrase [Planctomycetales bacterium]